MQTNPDSWPAEKAGKLHVLRRYPDHWPAVIAMLEQSEEFRSLCNDYGLASDALSRMGSGQDHGATRARRDEYLFIILELETEIRNYIDEYKSSVK
jgi:hypothetical protein